MQRQDYRPFANLPPKDYIVKPLLVNSRRSRYPSEQAISDGTFEETRNVLACWLEYPERTTISRYQGGFIQTLVDLTDGTEILLVDAVWEAYLHPKGRLFGKIQMGSVHDHHMVPLKHALASHPIAFVDSPERRMINEIAATFTQFQRHVPEKIVDHTPEAGDTLESFLLDLLVTLVHPEPQHDDTSLIREVKRNIGLLSPYRNLTPSQFQVLQPEGPFQTEYMKTRAGFFSALIYRGITFATRSVHDTHQNRFADLQAWSNYYHRVNPVDPKYFCDKKAYGTLDRTRTVDNVEEYWRTSAIWEPRLTEGFKSFTECWEFLAMKKDR